MFKEFRKNVGDLQVGDQIEVIFELEPGNSIISARGSCGCTNVTVSREGNEVRVLYKAEQIPHHLKEAGMFYMGKTINTTVSDIDGKEQEKTLTIYGKVYQTLEK